MQYLAGYRLKWRSWPHRCFPVCVFCPVFDMTCSLRGTFCESLPEHFVPAFRPHALSLYDELNQCTTTVNKAYMWTGLWDMLYFWGLQYAFSYYLTSKQLLSDLRDCSEA